MLCNCYVKVPVPPAKPCNRFSEEAENSGGMADLLGCLELCERSKKSYSGTSIVPWRYDDFHLKQPFPGCLLSWSIHRLSSNFQ